MVEAVYNREHLYESRKPWDSTEHTRRVRRFAGHILHLPIDIHQQMNRELGEPDFALMSLRMSNTLMPWANAQPIGTHDKRVKFIEQEELWFRRLGAFQRLRPLGREAIYFADCLEMKLPYYREGQSCL
jgi:hypothetical protein